jgi:hypothetical protein
MNRMYQAPELSLGMRYQFVLKPIFVSMFFSSVHPFTIVMAMLIILSSYWIDKYNGTPPLSHISARSHPLPPSLPPASVPHPPLLTDSPARVPHPPQPLLQARGDSQRLSLPLGRHISRLSRHLFIQRATKRNNPPPLQLTPRLSVPAVMRLLHRHPPLPLPDPLHRQHHHPLPHPRRLPRPLDPPHVRQT